jgi:hypothetical protein
LSYISGVDFISSTDEVRRLARKAVVGDFTDPEIESYQYKVYSLIRTMTDKDDWDPLDREYGAFQLFETEIAAELIKQHYGTAQQSAAAETSLSSLFAEMQKLIDNIDTTIISSTSRIRHTPYKSWNLNPDVPVPRRGLTII